MEKKSDQKRRQWIDSLSTWNSNINRAERNERKKRKIDRYSSFSQWETKEKFAHWSIRCCCCCCFWSTQFALSSMFKNETTWSSREKHTENGCAEEVTSLPFWWQTNAWRYHVLSWSFIRIQKEINHPFFRSNKLPIGIRSHRSTWSSIIHQKEKGHRILFDWYGGRSSIL